MFYADVLDVLVIITATLFAALMLWRPLKRVASSGLKNSALAVFISRTLVALALPAVITLVVIGSFESLRLVYHMGAVVSMIVAVALAGSLFAGRKHSDRPALFISAAFALGLSLVLPFAVHMTFIAPYQVVIERVDVPIDKNRAGEQPVKIVVLADIQTTAIGEYEEEVLSKVNALEPDLILIAGDVLQNYSNPGAYTRHLPAMQGWLNRLESKHGVYYVRGDVDAEAERLVGGVDMTFLKDQKTEPLRIKDRVITIGGVELTYWQPPAKQLVRQLEEAPGEEDIRIVLAHRPGVVEMSMPTDARKSRVDLVVAGHTHGGQVSIPFFGPPITMSVLPRHIAAGGLHAHHGRRVYVSRGVGMERDLAPRMRLNCHPEITLLTLR